MKSYTPSKEEIAQLEIFTGLTLPCIHLPATIEEFSTATADIMTAGIVGFDTESRPTFAIGEKSDGPHVLQFALRDKAYLFQISHPEGHRFLIELLQSKMLIKVGFGLKSDSRHIHKKLGILPQGLMDLNTVFSLRGFHKEIGVRGAVAVALNQRFSKSRKVTTSNWSQPQLTSPQILYAANDAYAALKVLEALNLPRDEYIIMHIDPALSSPAPV